MMKSPLSTYLSDHLARAMFAAELLRHMQESKSGSNFMGQMLAEIEHDRDVLQKFYDQIEDGGNLLKESSAWCAEKIARLKLTLGGDTMVGELESLETLSLGVLGKYKRQLQIPTPV